MYEKCIKEELDKQKMVAISMANATTYASPSYSKESARKKQRTWQRFIDSLDWDKLVDTRRVQSPKNIKKVFKGLKIPVAKGKKKEGVDQ